MTSTSPVLAGPPGDCCYTFVKHSGTPTGSTSAVAGVPTYVAEPAAKPSGPKRVILYFSDVYGPFFVNNQLIMDYFAENGMYHFAMLSVHYMVIAHRVLCSRH